MNKIESNLTYLAATNYWTPLQSNDVETDDKTKEANNIHNTSTKETPKANKWERRLARQQEKRLVIDSGATSHFCSKDLDLPEEGKSSKSVHLPNGNTLVQMTKKTSLPFQKLSKKAREAHVLPHLQQSLMSVNILSEEGYTTIFHPENKEVTVHKKGTLTITTSNPPVLQGCKEKGDNLWTVSANEEGEEESNNVYNLPSTKQSICYLHALAGFPVESKWIKAIKAGNYVTWPGTHSRGSAQTFPRIR